MSMRGSSRGRGPYRGPRGRPGPPVEDLREKLNRMRSENPQERSEQHYGNNRPPPDPPYNYLKDSSRDEYRGNHRYHQQDDYPRANNYNNYNGPRNDNYQPRGHFRGRFNEGGRARGRGRGNFSYTTENIQQPGYFEDQRHRQRSFHRGRSSNRGAQGHTVPYKQRSKSVEAPRNANANAESAGAPKKHVHKYAEQLKNPININVSFSTESGTRKCELDEKVILPEIKHQPNHYLSRGSFRGHNSRGKGAFKPLRKPNTIEKKTDDDKNDTEAKSNEKKEQKQEKAAKKSDMKHIEKAAKNSVESEDKQEKAAEKQVAFEENAQKATVDSEK